MCEVIDFTLPKSLYEFVKINTAEDLQDWEQRWDQGTKKRVYETLGIV